MKLQYTFKCHEETQDMDARGSHFFCGSCEKEVTDLRSMSADEIIEFFKVRGNTCAMMFEDQMEAINDRPLELNHPTRPMMLPKAAAVAAGLMMSQSMSAQTPVDDALAMNVVSSSDVIAPDNAEIIEVQLLDKNGLALANKRIQIRINKGNDPYNLTTNNDGKIRLDVPKTIKVAEYEILVPETGEMKTIKINEATASHCIMFTSQVLVKEIKPELVMKGKVVWQHDFNRGVKDAPMAVLLPNGKNGYDTLQVITCDKDGNFELKLEKLPENFDRIILKTMMSEDKYENGRLTRIFEGMGLDVNNLRLDVWDKKKPYRNRTVGAVAAM